MNQVAKFSPPHPLNTAVLFLVFNRLDTTKQVFQAIRQAKPPRLYVASDGARLSKEGEAHKVKEVRDYIIRNIDWDCEVNTLLRDKNLGCKYAVSGAISWFFENEEQGIILEDDCLPSQSFFWYCEQLLNHYAHDMRIGQISGTNNLGVFNSDNVDYFFSNYGSIWGWASWRRAWNAYDIDMNTWKRVQRSGALYRNFCNKNEIKRRSYFFEKTYRGDIQTWDFQWIFARLVNRFLVVIPSKNLVKNIGFINDSTHTSFSESNLSEIQSHEITLPVSHHPNTFLPNVQFEAILHKKKNGQKIVKTYHKIKEIGFLNTVQLIYERLR